MGKLIVFEASADSVDSSANHKNLIFADSTESEVLQNIPG